MTDQIYIGFPTESLDALVNKVKRLPQQLAPQFFTRGERVSSKLDRLDDYERFSNFYSRARKSSFGMIGEKVFFEFQPNVFRDNLRAPKNGYLYISFKKGFQYKEMLTEVLTQLLEVQGVSFGYVAPWKESSHRHRVKKIWQGTTTGASSTEMTIGVDYTKYVPGLYWKTVFSESYLSEHNLDVRSLSSIAIETDIHATELGTKFYIFKFYNDAKMWESNIDFLEDFCMNNNQFFSMKRLRINIDSAQTEAKLAEVIAPYC